MQSGLSNVSVLKASQFWVAKPTPLHTVDQDGTSSNPYFVVDKNLNFGDEELMTLTDFQRRYKEFIFEAIWQKAGDAGSIGAGW